MTNMENIYKTIMREIGRGFANPTIFLADKEKLEEIQKEFDINVLNDMIKDKFDLELMNTNFATCEILPNRKNNGYHLTFNLSDKIELFNSPIEEQIEEMEREFIIRLEKEEKYPIEVEVKLRREIPMTSKSLKLVKSQICTYMHYTNLYDDIARALTVKPGKDKRHVKLIIK